MITPPPPRRSRTPLLVAVGLVLGLVVAGVIVLVVVKNDSTEPLAAAPTATSTAPSEDDRLATARDEALAAAEEVAKVFNTLDYRRLDAGLAEWEGLATGPLLDQLRNNRQQMTDAVTKAKSVSTGSVLAAAAEEVNADKGTAQVLVATSVQVELAGSAQTAKRLRLRVGLERTPDGWKASDLGQVNQGG
ncbi:hypothetical protein [Actinophytocola sp.]|uniref:hypothetical protein n=1 Tax=Actinophytocola sp. TaxID=1872138 RepID=UPI002EDB0695